MRESTPIPDRGLASTPKDDTLIHWRHTLVAQEAGQKTAVLEHGRLWGVAASKFSFFLFSLESCSERVCAEFKPGYGGRGVFRATFKIGKPTTQHVEVIYVARGLFFPLSVYFSCGMAKVERELFGS